MSKSKYGKFIGEVCAVWLHEHGEDRRMKLTEDFCYIDRYGTFWSAPFGSVIDGASIPRPFWRICDPFIGDYRMASVVHDVACVDKKKSWYDTHIMFYNAMLCAGVGHWKAKVMFLAVFLFGPKW